MKTILFICTGNTCRSPMAEAVARHWTSRGSFKDADVFVASAGVFADPGSPVSPETLRALARWEIVHDGAAKSLTAEMIERADVVFGMTAQHVESARQLVSDSPEDVAKIMTLDPEGDLEDPIGMGQSTYDALAERLMELIPNRIKEMLFDAHRTGSGSPGS